MRIHRLAACLVIGASLASCATAHPGPLGELADGPLTRHGVLHPVLKGQTLWRIAHTYGVSVQDLAEVNDLTDPTKLVVGQALWIPGAERLLEVPPVGTPASPKPRPRPTPKPGEAHVTPRPAETHVAPRPTETHVVATAPVKDDPAPPPPADEVETPVETRHSRFIWPVKGPLGSRFGVRDGTQHDGIDIDAPKGTSIVAADAGDVLYAGEQRGYGNLVLLRHADNLITVYAHNDENRVKAGDHVKKGAEIAIVGQTGRATGPHLHFEVRQDRLPRNPLFFLP